MEEPMEELKFSFDEEAKLLELDVIAVYLFGSRAEGLQREGSDYDFAFLLKDGSPVKPGKNFQNLYQEIYEILVAKCFKDLGKGLVDIVFLQSGVSLELQANVVKHGKLLLDQDPEKRVDFEEQVMMRIADLRPIINQMDEDIIARI